MASPRLRSAPTGTAAEAELEAKGEGVRALVSVIEPLVLHIQKLSAAVEHGVTTHADGKLVTSVPRIGRTDGSAPGFVDEAHCQAA